MKFEQDQFYHIYNRGNRHTRIFYSGDNYRYFLKKLKKHISPFATILAYCLMPNHFHVLVYTSKALDENELNHSIGVMLRSYTRAINKQESQTGSLFQSATKAKLIKNCDTSLVCFNYIHLNPLKAGLIKKLRDWDYSSYLFYANSRKDEIVNREDTEAYLGIRLENYQEDIQHYLPDEHTVKALF